MYGLPSCGANTRNGSIMICLKRPPVYKYMYIIYVYIYIQPIYIYIFIYIYLNLRLVYIYIIFIEYMRMSSISISLSLSPVVLRREKQTRQTHSAGAQHACQLPRQRGSHTTGTKEISQTMDLERSFTSKCRKTLPNIAMNSTKECTRLQ